MCEKIVCIIYCHDRVGRWSFTKTNVGSYAYLHDNIPIKIISLLSQGLSKAKLHYEKIVIFGSLIFFLKKNYNCNSVIVKALY